jgi:hypothetical protein
VLCITLGRWSPKVDMESVNLTCIRLGANILILRSRVVILIMLDATRDPTLWRHELQVLDCGLDRLKVLKLRLGQGRRLGCCP